MISFEIDDRSGEDLVAGPDLVHAGPGAHDVAQWAAGSKKGRMAVQVQMMTRPDTIDAGVEACFRETTRIGRRSHLGRALRQRFTDVAGQDVRLTLIDRPGGVTGNVAASHLKHVEGHAAHACLRRAAERQAGPL